MDENKKFGILRLVTSSTRKPNNEDLLDAEDNFF